MSRRSSRASVSDGEFFTDCKAAYVEVVKDVRKDITSKSLLLQALQESGRNPSERVLKKYWNSSTDGISFDDFVDICRKEHVTSDDEMMKAFRKIDTNGDGYLSLDELFKIMTSKGEKMTRQEVREIIDEVDENGDGKLDYKERKFYYEQFCNMNRATADQLRQRNRKRLERVEKGDRRSKKVESFSDSKRDDMPRPSPRSNKKGVKHVPASKLGHLTEEPKNKRDWTKTTSKGCFFIDEDDGLMTHTYRLNLNERSKVWITVQPSIPQSMIIGDTTPIDTMLLVTKKKPDSEGRSVVGFTEKRDGKGKYGVMCELKAGSYNLLPFTTGCHLKARRSDSSKETPLVRKDRDGKTSITKAFRKALEEIFELSDLDGNGTLSRDEFTWFTLRTSGDKVTDDEWAVVEDTVELENNEITKKGFVKLNEMEADDVDDDISDLWVTLNSMGYNKDLFIDEACPYKLDVYTESCDDAEVALTCTGIETINNDMIIETVMEQDEGVKIKGSVYMYTYANDTRSTVVLSNRSNNSVNVTMDCTSSKNCQISQDNEEYTVTLDPHEKQIAHHLMPLDETLDWTPRCVEAVTK
ncbi:EF-hand calcium-binding domain-containing protein 7-like isoform X8 [Pecten maximus]|uniref:EF-hand calcium-binding domain-containing protein 7-like isoform X8 n=1 Tax=Pecten maximus TaxID=6579 RepID=UPI001457FC81|nr:EF-hand calcium-binding domain-containing protein 7-like isoform X8 [Pecten maximus]